MKSEGTSIPAIVEVIRKGDSAELYARENIELTEKMTDSGDIENLYRWDEYIITVKWRDNLVSQISANKSEWVSMIKDCYARELASKIREKRDKLLHDTDWIMYTDSPVDSETKAKYAEYRQALRDIPQQDGFPFNVVYPEVKK